MNKSFDSGPFIKKFMTAKKNYIYDINSNQLIKVDPIIIYDRALEFQLKAIEIQEAVLDSQHPDCATSYNNLSQIYQDMGQLDEALRFAEKAVAILQTLFPGGHPNLTLYKRNLDIIKEARSGEISGEFMIPCGN